MSDDKFPNPDETFDEPDDSITYVRDVHFAYDGAEDVKVVRFEGDSKAFHVGITDESMVEFLKVAEAVYTKIHGDMAEMEELFRDAENEAALRDRLDVPDPTDTEDDDDE